MRIDHKNTMKCALGHVQRQPGAPTRETAGAMTELIPVSRLRLEDVRGDPNRAREFREAGIGSISRKPRIEALLATAQAVAWAQLNPLYQKLEDGETLLRSEEQLFHKLVDSITKLVREERAQQRHEAIEDLDQATLAEKAIEALTVLGILPADPET